MSKTTQSSPQSPSIEPTHSPLAVMRSQGRTFMCPTDCPVSTLLSRQRPSCSAEFNSSATVERIVGSALRAVIGHYCLIEVP